MTTTAANKSLLHALRLADLHATARSSIENDGCIGLCDLITEAEFEIMLGATPEEQAALYEPLLLKLEVDCGPLAIYDNNYPDKTWGYGGRYDETAEARSAEHEVDLARKRIISLGIGHPDQQSWNSGVIPNTLWCIADFDDSKTPEHAA